MTRVLLVLLAGSVAHAAVAAFTLGFVPVDNSSGVTDGVSPINPATDFTFDLIFDSADEVWSATNLTASVTGATFFQHALSDNVLNPIAPFPATEFDTSAIAPYGAYLEAPGVDISDTEIDHAYGDTNANLQDPGVNPVGIYRFTVRLNDAGVPGTLTVGGELSTLQAISQPFGPLVITVPEPAGLALFSLCTLILRRR